MIKMKVGAVFVALSFQIKNSLYNVLKKGHMDFAQLLSIRYNEHIQYQ